MKLFVYSNCQGQGFSELLPRVTPDIEVSHVRNYLAFNDPESPEVIAKLASEADMFVYQPLPSVYGQFSTEENVDGNVTSRLRPDCVKISVPYVYNDGLWPLVEDGGAYKGAEFIEKYLNDGADVEEIIKLYDNIEIDFKLRERYGNSLQILRDKEISCDIKLADFIDINIKDNLMFRTQNHPTTRLFTHMLRSFVTIIGRDSSATISELDALYRHENNNLVDLPLCWPIDKYSIKEFNFSFISEPDECAREFYINYIRIVTSMWTKSSSRN